jgi:hypothetical protein
MIATPHSDTNAIPGQTVTPGCCLHIGLPKTATKTLQMGMFVRHSDVDYLGTYSVENHDTARGSFLPKQCRDQHVAQLMNELIWDNYKQPDFSLCRDLYAHAVQPSPDGGRVPVFSWESLLENRHEVMRKRAENLREIFGPCRVLAMVRHPLNLIQSLYLQLLKRDNVGGRAYVGRRPHYQPFDRWIESNWKKPSGAPNVHLEYAKSIEVFADVFGRKNVSVFVFEQLIDDSDAYYTSICQFVGINADEGIAHVSGQHENPRWSDEQLRFLREIKSSWLQSLAFQFSTRPMRCKMLGLPSDHKGIPDMGNRGAQLSLSENLKQQLLDKTREGNQWLMETWSLPLDEFNYPI